MGPDVEGFRPGDRVAAHPVHPCGRCANCRDGLAHLCRQMGHFGINMPGTFAEAFLVRADRARVLPAGVPLTTAALAEPVCVCLEALAQARLAEGGRLLIIGDGPFGAIMARLAEAMPLEQTVIAGHHDFRLGVRRPCAQGEGRPRKRTRARRCWRRPAGAATMPSSWPSAGREAAQLGLGAAEGRRAGWSSSRPSRGGRPSTCSACTCASWRSSAPATTRTGWTRPSPGWPGPGCGIEELVTHRLPLERYADALELARSGREEAMKVAFVFDEAEAP